MFDTELLTWAEEIVELFQVPGHGLDFLSEVRIALDVLEEAGTARPEHRELIALLTAEVEDPLGEAYRLHDSWMRRVEPPWFHNQRVLRLLRRRSLQ